MLVFYQVAYAVLLAGISATLLVGRKTDNFAAVVNGAASLALALSPIAVEFGLGVGMGVDVTFGQALPLWLALAGFLHMVGMLGWYDSVWWWDHLTHTVSAGLVAALVFAGLHTLVRHSPNVQLSAAYIAVFTLLFTLGIGVLWEFVELVAREVGERIGHPPVLHHYGLRDTALDLLFDCVGALLVIALDIRTFVPVTEQRPELVEPVLVALVIGIVGGSIVLALLVAVEQRE
ncbi:hypothetical protein OB919_05165 [Halobacteria archaeon AArc-curdl1]|uniref:Uncharacterized protein n=1 Tax=Natronosalvus hydrolyticus TaxID=2979988 RepID=A0AAP3E5U4_9EURY|nr:hypothetical protein [Halobacteria archaeon AArc-curdl1]